MAKAYQICQGKSSKPQERNMRFSNIRKLVTSMNILLTSVSYVLLYDSLQTAQKAAAHTATLQAT